MTSGSRLPSWKERENNKRRERRRRAIAAKIYSGLRMYGNYKLPKHCDNNEVLKALCDEAGWTVEPDGTTYRKGCKPPEQIEATGGASTSASPRSSYQPSPFGSYNPSPTSSSFPSPRSSPFISNTNFMNNAIQDANSLIPWLKNLSSSSSSPFMHNGSLSAPVTPPLSSPTIHSPRLNIKNEPPWASGSQYSYLPSSSTPASPGSTAGPTSPTFSLVAPNPSGFFVMSEGSSRMWTPGQSGMCSPVLTEPAGPRDVCMVDSVAEEFAFGSSLVKPWEGERIHEECGDDLELTLGSSKTRGDAR